MTNNFERLIIHHTGVSSSGPQLYAVNRYHKAKDFPLSALGWHVGYHYFIDVDGSLTRTRNDHEEGAHTIGWNNKSIGICVAGDFTKNYPTKAQREMLANLVHTIGLPLKFHRECQPDRTCPGLNLSHSNLFKDEDWEKNQGIQNQLTLIQKMVDKLRAAISTF